MGYLSTRNSDKRKMAHEDLRSNRQIIRETATAFSEVCSAVIEKAIDSKNVFNSVLDAAQNMQGELDKKALEKVQYAVDLMDEAKRVTTAFNNLRVVAPVPVLQKASALNAAVLALTQATTVPLAKPPLMAEAAKAFEDFTNAVRAELGLDAYTAEDANRARTTYMEALTEQMNDYIKETREEFRRNGFLEPGAVSTTPIKAGDLTEGHVGKLVGCHDPQTGFNYGAKIVNVIRQEDGPLESCYGCATRLCRAGNQRMKIALDSDSTTSYNLSKRWARKSSAQGYLPLVALPRLAAARPTLVCLFLVRAWRAKLARAADCFLVVIACSSRRGVP